jgi:hypothetical protein
MVGKAVRFTVVGAAVLGLAGCGGGGSSTADTTTSTAANATFRGFAECAFPAGGPVTTVGLATVGPSLTVSWDTPTTIPDADSSVLVVTVGPYRIGFERDGRQLIRYVFDSTTGEKTELTGSYIETQQGISMTVLFSAVPKLTKRVPWHASVGIDGTEVARCPAEGSERFGDRNPTG